MTETDRILLRPGVAIVNLPRALSALRRDLEMPPESAQFRAAVVFREELERAFKREGRKVEEIMKP